MRHKQLTALLVAIIVVAAIVAAALLPPWRPASSPLTLSHVQLLACPVGETGLGSTSVQVSDGKDFDTAVITPPSSPSATPSPTDAQTSADSPSQTPADTPSETPTATPTASSTPAPSSVRVIDQPAATVVARGSSMLGGVSTYTQGGAVMMAPCTTPLSYGAWNGVDLSGDQVTLIVTNVDATPAVVDVFMYGEAGPITVPGLSDIPVAAGASQLLAINALAQSDRPITVVVRASKGRVLGILRIIGQRGVDWQLPQTTPSTDVVIPVVPSGDGIRTLSITNSGTQTATVGVMILGETGSFPPLGLESVSVPSNDCLTVDITSGFAGQASAVHLQSDQPITAAVVAGGADLATVSGQPALTGSLAFPGVGGTVWLANPSSQDAIVTIQSDDNGQQQTTTLQVPAQAIAGTDFPTGGRVVVMSDQAATLWADLVVTSPSTSIVPLIAGGLPPAASVPSIAPGLG